MSILHESKPTVRRTFGVRAASLFAVFCILASIALVRDGKIFSHSFSSTSGEAVDSISAIVSDGTSTVINTTEPGKNIIGYAGIVPLNIYITAGRIDSVRALPNTETPSFFGKASALLAEWDGLTIAEARDKHVDAISGATFSSKAIIDNVQAGLSTYSSAKVEQKNAEPEIKVSYICALIVAIAAAVLPFIIKHKWYRTVQQILNVAVLGFWTGTFLDYTLFLKVFANSLPMTFASLLTIILFVVAFIFPLFRRTGYYCAWVCPLGSLQELCGRIPVFKIRISAKTISRLTYFRNILWCVLIISLWTGVLASWIDYELFTAFIVESASAVVLTVGAVFVILSLFIMRPFCRFVCPVGTLLNHAEGRN